ncbi:MAG: PTS sugar transporter subunit IIB [Endomicrobium sp.]|jgi:PTS system mannose-specific IIB component|nr:PTS sugar transporter subunit IIB [Endomicrobium sp.]
MSIVLVRIDDRLVHGQIVQGWLKMILVDILLVVSDIVACDKMQQMLMTLAMPSDVRLDMKNLKDATNAIISGQYNKKRVMILLVCPDDVLYMIEKGADFKSVNVGGMHFVNGKRQLFYNICVDDKDIESLYKIYSKGIEVEGRILPDGERVNIMPVIEKEYLAFCKSNK